MTAEISNPWATLDELLGVEVVEAVDEGVGPVAFYGRCSTEDNQDPETSHGWQLSNAQKFVEPLGGRVVAEFFDVGQSRSVPWERRGEAARLLAALKNPARGWNAVVVGEGTRCWFGNQFSLVAPKFAAYGVELWVPELGGKFDPRNPSHKMLMSVLGGMSESERQHVQARVRAAMDAQVINEGRHQGGRAPYGYVVVDGGPHPNPRKAAEGYRLRVLAIDESAAEVVRRIFSEYLSGKGDRAIANELNRDGVPCPSARRPDQNRHRLADGWQGSSVRVILENPRYTGYAFFGRWVRHESLLDSDDVAAGHVTRFRRSTPDRVVRSRTPAHPAIVSVEEFTQAQLLRRSKAAGGLATARKSERGGRVTARTYLLRGLVRCGVCNRKMQGATIRKGAYYRCTARTMAPGSAQLADHPKTVNIREDAVVEAINGWIGRLFDPENVDATVAALVGSQDDGRSNAGGRDAVKRRLAEAEARLRRYQAAIGSGVDPAALVDVINQAQAERAAAKAELGNAPKEKAVSEAEVYAMIDSLGDLGTVLTEAKPVALERLYQALNLQLRYEPKELAVYATTSPRVGSVRVRGGT
ncbi:recombinase family protein [Amycolatopsis acidiphila]|uniref:Recombinase family protein n=1 Tax=Amycolatopsis acidiphila TaxID=715473 RepID=A0A558A6Y3_9PSEU|nr:recombinase family protein [Amycolatopsis acidiphila]TVT20020.1 recombinase family protein [Amycolatopsis acidiphila]UIJ63482.1 recombinase family protein [Amycolatopsis acidiphila]GHG68666.1 recombinase [Amycolatopsis acidiphila]